MNTELLDGASVLIIDPDSLRRRPLVDCFERVGMTVTEASLGEEGLLEALHQPDLIVVAVHYPDISGLEVMRRLRGDPLTQDIPIIQRFDEAISPADRVEGLAMGMDSYLVDPIHEDVLLATMRSLLRHRDLTRQLELALSLGVTGVYDWAVPTGVVRWSASLERIHGIDEGEFGGTFEHFAATVHPDDRERIGRELRDALAAADALHLTFRFVRTDGSSGWIESHGRVFRNAHGEAVRLLGLAHDVTTRMIERERIDQLYRLASGLAAARTAVGVLAILERELEPSGLDVRLANSNDPTASDAAFSSPIGEHRLDLIRRPTGEHTLSARQATAIGELGSSALERAFQYEAERANAISFQRALLPNAFPRLDGWTVTAEYDPASSQDRLGGDFYDITSLDDRIVIAIGDVAGHGRTAMQQVGTVRTLLRTLSASLDGDPQAVILRANELFDTVCGPDAPFVTVSIALLDTRSGRIDIASAGHPPPIYWAGDRPHLVDLSPGPPLGVHATGDALAHPLELPPGAWLAFYTDGVFESRRAPLDDVIDSICPLLGPDLDAARLLRAGATINELNPDDRATLVISRSARGEV